MAEPLVLSDDIIDTDAFTNVPFNVDDDDSVMEEDADTGSIATPTSETEEVEIQQFEQLPQERCIVCGYLVPVYDACFVDGCLGCGM